jgi:hypothetical protein
LSGLLAAHRIAQGDDCRLSIASMTTNMRTMLILTNLYEQLVGQPPDDSARPG